MLYKTNYKLKASNNQLIEHNRVISQMFNDIAPSYDFLNRFLSLGIDKIWRRAVIKKLKKVNPSKILDIATGTADLAILEAQKIKDCRVLGVDIAEQMLTIGNKKISRLNIQNQIELAIGDGQCLAHDNDSFDATTIAFRIRNFENPVKGISEMYRVIKPNGMTLILEFTKTNNKLFQGIFEFYFGKILPHFGRLISKHSTAYNYLPNSVAEFNNKFNIAETMQKQGFINISAKRLTYGVVTLYSGYKPNYDHNYS